MTNITIRNIPDDVMDKIRILSETERRSINSEILFILEKGLNDNTGTLNDPIISKSTQVKIWTQLSGKWEDDRTTESIIEDLYQSRTLGREFSL